jgi:hypothetical protein
MHFKNYTLMAALHWQSSYGAGWAIPTPLGRLEWGCKCRQIWLKSGLLKQRISKLMAKNGAIYYLKVLFVNFGLILSLALIFNTKSPKT